MPTLLCTITFVIPLPLILLLTPFLYKLCSKCCYNNKKFFSSFIHICQFLSLSRFWWNFMDPINKNTLSMQECYLYIALGCFSVASFPQPLHWNFILFASKFSSPYSSSYTYSEKYNIAIKLDTLIFCNLSIINALTVYNHYHY